MSLLIGFIYKLDRLVGHAVFANFAMDNKEL